MNDCVNAAEAFGPEVSNVSADVREHSPYMSPVIIDDVQHQIGGNVALKQL